MSKTAKVVAINYANLVDRLGELNALKAPIEDEINDIKQALRDSGYDVVEGKAFRVSIGETKEKAYIDYQSVAEAGIKNKDKLAQLVATFSVVKEVLGQVRISAKVRG